MPFSEMYMKIDGIKAVTLTPYAGAAALVTVVRKTQPRGVDQMLIGQAAKPGYAIVKNRQGIIAILIGLLQPSVQKLEAPGSSDLQLLRGAVKPTGAAGIMMGDGSVRHLFGPRQITLNYDWVDWNSVISQ